MSETPLLGKAPETRGRNGRWRRLPANRVLPLLGILLWLAGAPTRTQAQDLYGLASNGSNSFQVLRIAPETGAATLVATLATSAMSGATALDPSGHRLFAYGTVDSTVWNLYTVDLMNGTASLAPTVSNLFGLRYDSSSGALYGLVGDDAASSFHVLRITPETGAVYV